MIEKFNELSKQLIGNRNIANPISLRQMGIDISITTIDEIRMFRRNLEYFNKVSKKIDECLYS
jgi:hypothetical protein